MADQIEIQVPAGWSQEQIDAFLQHLNEPKTTTQKTDQAPQRHCYLNDPCAFWYQDGDKTYLGHCGLGSSACLTKIFNGDSPSRWQPKSIRL